MHFSSWSRGTCQSLKVLRSKGLSPEPIIERTEGKLRLDMDPTATILEPSVFLQAGGIFFCLSNIQSLGRRAERRACGRFPALRSLKHALPQRGYYKCLPQRSAACSLQLLGADAVLEYWQAVFHPKLPAVCFEGRG